MPGITDQAIWEPEIYKISMNDDVGGPNGVENLQAGQLANRTAWLKQEVSAAQVGMAWHEVATDPHPQYMTVAESQAAISLAVAQLVNSSPAALDTLAELATALGNDPNYAATITNALAGKTPWTVVEQILTAAGIAIDHNNPAQLLAALRSAGVFQTAPQFDISTKPATMEALKREMGNYSGLHVFVDSQVLDESHAGGYLRFNIAAASSCSLPVLPPRCRMTITNIHSSSAALTLHADAFGSVLTPIGSPTTFVMNPGTEVDVVSLGGGSYDVINGAGAAILDAIGGQKYSTGLIRLWGHGSVTTVPGVATAWSAALPTTLSRVLSARATPNNFTHLGPAVSCFDNATFPIAGPVTTAQGYAGATNNAVALKFTWEIIGEKI